MAADNIDRGPEKTAGIFMTNPSLLATVDRNV